MDKTQEALKKETEKWLAKIEDKKVKVLDPKAEPEVKNLKAYIKDTYHFMKKDDWVRAFEAVIYAWGILETLEHLGFISS
jgi:hypothetical protein